ncbi:hypothetical protein NLG97_g1669 [Lecanicillium saksenae]|uniref:Uncharacterized protein n=1 Tax=Lecanicillium saksenae TaxID=468837 RepID=A0ACC1R3B9_9HYPO|nr:hypothetical protein NLG97_g1669 [Lecanicillium saksenae]
MAVKPIRACPGRSATDTEQNWYHLRLAPNLGICSRCYHDCLAQTPFTANFGHENDTSGARRVCDFDVPRTRAILRQATEGNDFDIFKDYWVRRAKIPRCKGPGAGVAAADKFSWFSLADPNLADKFGACNACYEDHVLASPFASHFSSSPIQQPDDQTFVCDVALEFCHKLLGGTGDWGQISNWLLFRRNLPSCTGVAEADSASRRWHKLRAPEFDSLLTCEACYYDAVHNTIAADHFQPNPVVLPPNHPVVCMYGGNIPLRVVFDEAERVKDWSVFHRAAQVVVRSPPCRKEGTASPVWYSLIPADAEVDICQTCYTCFFQALGAGHILQPKYVPPGQLRLCNMNLAAPHVTSIYSKLDMAVDSGNFDTFTKFVRSVMHVPPCPGNKPAAGLRWYTHDLFTCCPSCWLTAPIEGTQLSGCFSAETMVPTQLKCDFYSTRVRDLWRVACIENDLAGFSQFMKKRLEIWQQTYPAIQQHLQMMKMNMERQATLMMASVINTGANNIAAASAPVGMYGHYGNSAIGYGYETMAGAQGAIQFNQAVGMNAANGAPMMSIVQLEGLWKSVE